MSILSAPSATKPSRLFAFSPPCLPRLHAHYYSVNCYLRSNRRSSGVSFDPFHPPQGVLNLDGCQKRALKQLLRIIHNRVTATAVAAEYNQSARQFINSSTNQSINRSINPSIHQSVNQTTDQSINQSIKHDQSINQSFNQSINQYFNQSINQYSNQSIIQYINQPIKQSINQSINQSIGQPIN